MAKNITNQFRYTDILIWVSFGLMLVIKFLTIFIFLQVSEDTGAEIEAVATAYEQNPIAKMLMSLESIRFMVSVMILPAIGMALYYLMRRRVKKGKVDMDTLTFFVQFVFFLLLVNIINDGAVLFSKLVEII